MVQNCNEICIGRKGKAGLKCMQRALSWFVTLFPCLVSLSVLLKGLWNKDDDGKK